MFLGGFEGNAACEITLLKTQMLYFKITHAHWTQSSARERASLLLVILFRINSSSACMCWNKSVHINNTGVDEESELLHFLLEQIAQVSGLWIPQQFHLLCRSSQSIFDQAPVITVPASLF